MSDRTETLAGLVNLASSRAARNVYTCIPAKVVKYDASKGRVDCQILIKDAYEDEEGNRVAESYAVIPSVPVQFMGAGGYRLTFPIGDGSDGTEQTIGTLFFVHRSMDKWLSGNGAEVDPEFDHDHALTDAVFVPGLKPFGAPWSDVPTDGASLGKDGGLQMKVTNSLITLASDSSNAQFVALANLVKNELDAFALKYNTHQHTVAAAPGVAAATPDTYTPGEVAASKVKAE